MNILVIIDNGIFFYPEFTRYLIKYLKYRKLSFGVVTKIKKSNSINRYLIKNFYQLRMSEIILLIYQQLKIIFLNFIKKNKSVVETIKDHQINFFKIEFDINKTTYQNKIKKICPDIIICSSSVILKRNILKIPKYGCINRHGSLLPANAGILPVFYSICKKDKASGFTIHLMNEKIDQGKILYQKKIKIINNNMFKTYKKIFLVSSKYFNIAITNLLKKKYVKPIYLDSYNSFPTNHDWKLFRKNKGKFV